MTPYLYFVVRITSYDQTLSWNLGLPEGVLSNRPCPSVTTDQSVCPSVFKYLRDYSKDFLFFFHEVMAP